MSAVNIPDLRILLVEDEAFIRGTIKRLLQSLGSTDVQEAEDGGAALQLMTSQEACPHLVICDVQMAPMDGLTFLRQLRALEDRARARVPVIMLTAMADEATIKGSVNLQISGYLLKPVSRQALADRINALVRRPVARVPGVGADGAA